MLNSIQDQIRILQKKFLFATGTLIALELHDFAKLVLLKAYNSIDKFSIWKFQDMI